MPAYAYPIQIKKEKQKIRYHRKIELPEGLLTLEDISKHLKEGEKFGFREDRETSQFGDTIYMDIFGYRLETDEEQAKRIAKEQAYMKEYNKRKNSKQ